MPTAKMLKMRIVVLQSLEETIVPYGNNLLTKKMGLQLILGEEPQELLQNSLFHPPKTSLWQWH